MFELFRQNKKDPQDIKEILDEFKKLKQKFGEISIELENIKKENKINVQKIGILRFNPFSEVGGDQSFSLALLDANDDGVVLTSLYTRKENRVYGKPIKNGASHYLLSDEEIKAIEFAKNGNIQTIYDTEQPNKKPAANRRGPRPR